MMDAPDYQPQWLPAFALAGALHLLGGAALWLVWPSVHQQASEPPLQITVIRQSVPAAMPAAIPAAIPAEALAPPIPIKKTIAAPVPMALPAAIKTAPEPPPAPSAAPAMTVPALNPLALVGAPAVAAAAQPVANSVQAAPVQATPTTALPAAKPSQRSEIGLVCPVQVKPIMPPRAIAEGLSGTVVAQALIKDGAVKEVTILSGSAVYRAAVRSALMQYKCLADSAEVLAVQSFTFKVE